MCCLFASARSTMTSAAVCPWIAQCSLFCTVAKKRTRGPLAELHRALGVDLVADGDDGREAVALRVVGLAVGGSYPKRLDSCVLLQLAVREDRLQVVVDGADVDVVELRHHLLAQPHVLLGVDRLDAATVREAADAASLSVSGMKSRVQRGRAQLCAPLEACCEIAIDARGGVAEVTPRHGPGCCADRPRERRQ